MPSRTHATPPDQVARAVASDCGVEGSAGAWQVYIGLIKTLVKTQKDSFLELLDY